MPAMGATTAGRATTIHALHCGGDVQDWAVFDPLDERAGTGIYNPYFIFVVRHPQGTVLFDSERIRSRDLRARAAGAGGRRVRRAARARDNVPDCRRVWPHPARRRRRRAVAPALLLLAASSTSRTRRSTCSRTSSTSRTRRRGPARHLRARRLRRRLRLAAAAGRPRPVRRRQRAHRLHAGPHRGPPVAARAASVPDGVPAIRRGVPRGQDAGAPAAGRVVGARGDARDVVPGRGDRA